MKTPTRLMALLTVSLMCIAASVRADQASTVKVVSVPATARVNTTVTLSGALQDAWDNAGLVGRSVYVEVGERYYVTSTPFSTGGNGGFSRTWKFTSPGRYRVSFKFRGDGTFADSRVTTFINVTR